MSKGLVYTFIFIGGAIGSYAPVFFGQSAFSFVSIIGGIVGGIIGIWAAYQLGNNI